jgi:hypothetical protein
MGTADIVTIPDVLKFIVIAEKGNHLVKKIPCPPKNTI